MQNNRCVGIHSHWDYTNSNLGYASTRGALSKDGQSHLGCLSFKDIETHLSKDVAWILNFVATSNHQGKAVETENHQLPDLSKKYARVKDQLAHETQMGELFFQSPIGVELLAKERSSSVEAYKGSLYYRSDLMRESFSYFDKEVCHCRKLLRQSEKASSEVIDMLDYNVSDEEEDDEIEAL